MRKAQKTRVSIFALCIFERVRKFQVRRDAGASDGVVLPFTWSRYTFGEMSLGTMKNEVLPSNLPQSRSKKRNAKSQLRVIYSRQLNNISTLARCKKQVKINAIFSLEKFWLRSSEGQRRILLLTRWKNAIRERARELLYACFLLYQIFVFV